jgi:acetyltransferase-like isoleucine patch superfamily enzyme
VSVGRYVSVAHGVRFFLRNHPMDRLSTHPYFFNRRLGVAPKDVEEVGTLRIEHDAWIGENAIVTPGCRRIGIGAVVGAGSVVTRDVEDFAIVAGNPAKLIRHRFDEATQQAVIESRWWERSIEELRASLDVVMAKVDDRIVREAFGAAMEKAS